MVASEIVNQYTTLLGWFNGFQERDATARYLLTVSPVLETMVLFSIPFGLIVGVYLVGLKWTPSTTWPRMIRKIVVIALLIAMVLLSLSNTAAAIGDLYTLHAYHIV